jgi:poly(A) polymerase
MTTDDLQRNNARDENPAGLIGDFFTGPNLAARLVAEDAKELLFVLIPELREMTGLEQNRYHRHDVWTHSINALEVVEGFIREGFSPFAECGPLISASLAETLGGSCPRAIVLKMAALLHDLGKPRAREDRDGKVSFIGHESIGAEMIGDIARRIGLLPREAGYLELLVRNHLRPILLPEQTKVTGRAVHRLMRAAGEFLPDLLLLSWADIEATAGELMSPERVARHHAFVMRLVREFYFGKRESPDD